MNFKKTKLISMIIAASLCAANASAINSMANREICNPQSADMSQQRFFQTTCDWSTVRSGGDTVAMVTLHGRGNVSATCYFSGADSIALVKGSKHAMFKPLIKPGDYFNFEINYLTSTDESDDNQNIMFYLATNKPGYADELSCTFIAE